MIYGAKMWIFPPLTCLLFAPPAMGFFQGTCPRKEPAPGVLVLTPGQKLIMTCRGHVTVDGLKVRDGSNTSGGDGSQSGPSGALMKGFKQAPVNGTDAGNTSSSGHGAPPAHTVSPTSVHGLSGVRGVDQETEEEEEEVGNDGSRVTRGENSDLQWKWSGRTVENRQKDVKWSRGATLSLSSVTVANSGTFTCYHRGKERFSLKVIVADPPEKPHLYCYKKSPSSKIRCESEPQENIIIRPNCYLLLSKSPTEPFQPSQCSYSSRTSRCFCTLDHNEDEIRTVHIAYLCFSSVAGNITSNLLDFTPMRILKPDPPTNVAVREVEGEERWMKITWSLPSSWKSHDDFYDLIYQIKYRPTVSSFHYEQIHDIKGKRSAMITDAIPGVEYLIQVRTKEEYDGLWSNWSSAVNGCSWTAAKPTATTISIYGDIESSGIDISIVDVTPTFTTVPTEFLEVSTHLLWVSALFVASAVVLAVYLFRQRDRFLSKVQSLSLVPVRGALSEPQPTAPTAPEGQALVAVAPPSYRERPGDGQENQELCRNERAEGMNFSNTSYFFTEPSGE